MGLEFLNKMSGSDLSKVLQAQKVRKDFVAADVSPYLDHL
jgi:hypothetical protein